MENISVGIDDGKVTITTGTPGSRLTLTSAQVDSLVDALHRATRHLDNYTPSWPVAIESYKRT